MDIRQLKYFIQIVESGSLSLAAKELAIAQPALSQSIKNLEQDLGVELLKRHARGMSMTDAGRILYEHAQSILGELRDTRTIIQNIANNPCGTVRLGLPTTVTRGLVNPLLGEITRIYPEIELHIVEAMSGVLSEMLLHGNLDLALLFDSVPRHAVLIEPLVTEELFVLVGQSHQVAGHNAVTLKRLSELSIVLPSKQHTIRRIIDKAASTNGVKLKVFASVDSLTGLLSMAEAGHPTILPQFCACDRIDRGDLRAIEIVDPKITWSLHTVSPMRGGPTSASLAVNKTLRAVTRQLVEVGAWPAQMQ